MKRIGLLVLLIGVCAGAHAAQCDATAEAAEESKNVELFNGKDFSGWELYLSNEGANPKNTWSVVDGVVHCNGKERGYMRTKEQYSDYRLRLQWRFPGEPGNSGVLLHIQLPDMVWPKSIESQLHHENAGDFWVIEGAEFEEHADPDNKRVNGRRTIKLHDSSEKPVGEWNQYEIVCDGDTIKSYVNGVLQNEANGCSITKGYIGLQSEGAPIQFREIILEPLGE